jgi:OFA family oxalate/formate antiporter-like MFS transporter
MSEICDGNESLVFPEPCSSLLSNRWVQLSAGIVGMIAVANFQYGWTLFVRPLHQRHGWSEVAIQDALYLFFVTAQTWLVPLEGYLAERFGPRKLLFVGGTVAALGWVVNAYTSSLTLLYFAQVLSGCGSGIVYSISMGNALKWFPDRRGLAAGLTAAAFGAGSAATVRPIRWTIANAGFEAAFFWFGIGQGLVILLAALAMRFPRAREVPASFQSKHLQTGRDFTPSEMLRSPVFWLVYFMMMMGAIPGLLMLGQIAPMAADFGVAELSVTLLGTTSAALPLAIELDRIMGGLTRPVFGWLSDYIGREVAIFFAFALEGVSLALLLQYANDPLMFVLMSGLAFFGWGAVFSLFPAVSGDMFGRKFATTNYAWLYTAKGAAALLVALCNRLQAETGDWTPVFILMIAADWLAALLALCVLRPLRRRELTERGASATGENSGR